MSLSVLELTRLPDDCLRHLIAQHLHVADQLVLGRTCHLFKAEVDCQLASPTLSLSGKVVTDRFLLWLLRRLPEGALRTLDLSECTSLSRGGIIRALRHSDTHKLETLTAHRLGGASWSTEELRQLVDECPSLRELHADCRAQGVGAESLQVLVSADALRPRRLVLQREKIGRVNNGAAGAAGADDEAEEGAAGAVDEAAAVAAAGNVLPPPPPAVAANAAANADADEEAEEALLASQAPAFGEALSKCIGTLEELDVRGCDLGPADVAQVNIHMKDEQNALRRLLLPGATTLTEASRMRLFARAVGESERLESLQLACSSITADGASHLAGALKRSRSLLSLELQHNPLLDRGAISLGKALAVNESLRVLSVPFTGLGDGACAALARALREGAGLTSLDLAGNRLSAEGVEALALSLPLGCLESLTLSANAIGARGCVAVAQSLKGARTLTALRLDGCCIGASPCGRLSAALADSSVAHLDLSANEIGDLGGWELAWRLPECLSLRELRLASNEVEEDGGCELLSALMCSPQLRKLDLRGNRLDEKGPTAAAFRASERANVNFQFAPRPRFD